MRHVKSHALAFLMAALALLSSCGGGSKPPQLSSSRPPKHPRVETTIDVPGAQVHVIAIPGDALDVTRCVVAVSATGSIAATCAPKDVDLGATDQ